MKLILISTLVEVVVEVEVELGKNDFYLFIRGCKYDQHNRMLD